VAMSIYRVEFLCPCPGRKMPSAQRAAGQPQLPKRLFILSDGY
jgi:hypothetical protein